MFGYAAHPFALGDGVNDACGLTETPRSYTRFAQLAECFILGLSRFRSLVSSDSREAARERDRGTSGAVRG